MFQCRGWLEGLKQRQGKTDFLATLNQKTLWKRGWQCTCRSTMTRLLSFCICWWSRHCWLSCGWNREIEISLFKLETRIWLLPRRCIANRLFCGGMACWVGAILRTPKIAFAEPLPFSFKDGPLILRVVITPSHILLIKRWRGRGFAPRAVEKFLGTRIKLSAKLWWDLLACDVGKWLSMKRSRGMNA